MKRAALIVGLGWAAIILLITVPVFAHDIELRRNGNTVYCNYENGAYQCIEMTEDGPIDVTDEAATFGFAAGQKMNFASFTEAQEEVDLAQDESIEMNSENIESNSSRIMNNTQNIMHNSRVNTEQTDRIEHNDRRIVANSLGIAANRNMIDENRRLINQNREMIHRNTCGIAGIAAMTALPLTTDGKFSVAGGAGSYAGCNAGAIGGQLNMDSLNFRVLSSFSDSDRAVAGGVGYSW